MLGSQPRNSTSPPGDGLSKLLRRGAALLLKQVPSSAMSKEVFRDLAPSLGLQVQPRDEADYLDLLRATVADIETVPAMPPYQHSLIRTTHSISERTSMRPSPSDNPLNGWSHRTTIRPSAEGLLSGKTIAVKDNVSIAGLPMTGGTQPYHLSKDTPYPVSSFDAPVVTRVLEAGGTITGTSTCENCCMSALSFSSATGPVDNPWLKGYTCGGSSSGSAALVGVRSVRKQRGEGAGQLEMVAADDLGEGADMAIGGDQGGSIRIPAAYSGIYGLKPTHGLVPYTGIVSLQPMIDHCGPMAASVRDTALLLAVLAGWDGLDPRCTPETPLRQNVTAYHERLDGAIEERKSHGSWNPKAAANGLRVGLIEEAWAAPQLSEEVGAVVRQAGQRFASLGGSVEEVSIPMHGLAAAIFTAAETAEMADFIYNKPPDCLSWPMADLIPPAPDTQWFDTMNKSAPTVVSKIIGGEFLRRNKDAFAPAARGKAITHVHELRAAYDAALAQYDVLVTPCNPTVGMKHLSQDLSVAEKYALALGNTWNTSPFNLTGHPGLTMPVGWGRTEDGQGRLPIGMQLVGRRWDEETLFLAAAAWEVGGLGLDS